MAYRIGSSDVLLWTPIDGPLPQVLVNHIHSGGILEAHNAAFEQDIWEHIAVKRYGFPPVPARQWRDSMATCAALAIPLSLEKAGAALNAPVQKDPAGKAVMMKLSQPRKPTKKDKRAWFDEPELFEKLYAYCRQDVAAEHCISGMVPPLSAHEQEVWHASNAINRRGIAVDLPAVRGVLRMMSLAEADYHKAIHDATGGVINADNLGSWQVVVPWCAGRGVQLPNYQKGTLAEVVKQDIPADVAIVLNARLALGRTSTAKYQALIDRTSADGRLRNHLVYHGAGPGRWAGRGVQLQNLPRGGLKVDAVADCLTDMASMPIDHFRVFWGDPMAAASQCLRGCLIAAPGKTLIAADYSAIECRVVNWLAGQDDVTQAFVLYDQGKGLDAYKRMAALTYHCRPEDVTADQRNLGKAQELGCGFGCGAATFHRLATTPPYNCVLTEEEAAAAVDLYRETHPHVKSLWYQMEAAALAAIRAPGTVAECRAIRFKMQGPHLKMRLPSGRLLSYPFAKVEPRLAPWGEWKDAVTFMGEVGEGHVWMRDHTYGGSLVENAVQAIARDLMADAMLRAEERGFPCVLSVHDELVAEIDDVPIAATPQDFAAVMTELPPWAAGLPVAAAGWRGARYKK